MSRNKPITIISIWFPVAMYLAYLAITTSYDNPSFLDKYIVYQSPSFSLAGTILGFIFGGFLWTWAEYAIHRWIFHSDQSVPDNGWALWFHFLLHGVHHFIPQDKDRLVFPPGLAVLVFSLVYPTFMLLFGGSLAKLLLGGFIVAYICYDTFHYFSHHMTSGISYLMEQKRYHIRHHYMNGNLGYGITSKLWDKVYGTTLP